MPVHTVTLGAVLTLATAEVSRTTLAAALRGSDGVEVDCGAATQIDLSLVQLLLAARRSARERSVPFAVSRPIPADLCDILERGGFLAAGADPDALFRLAGETR